MPSTAPVSSRGSLANYTAKDEEGEQLPLESTRVQVRAEEVIDQVTSTLTKTVFCTEYCCSLGAKHGLSYLNR
jgi:hypothetical protein